MLHTRPGSLFLIVTFFALSRLTCAVRATEVVGDRARTGRRDRGDTAMTKDRMAAVQDGEAMPASGGARRGPDAVLGLHGSRARRGLVPIPNRLRPVAFRAIWKEGSDEKIPLNQYVTLEPDLDGTSDARTALRRWLKPLVHLDGLWINSTRTICG
jgi:hypothetical protein